MNPFEIPVGDEQLPHPDDQMHDLLSEAVESGRINRDNMGDDYDKLVGHLARRANPNPSSASPVEAFVARVAALTKDGEGLDGEPFNLSAEDAVATLERLITEARALTEPAAAPAETTPLPWSSHRVHPRIVHPRIDVDTGDGPQPLYEVSSKCAGGDWYDVGYFHNPDDAAFTCHAANLHHDLVEALKQCANRLNIGAEDAEEGGYGQRAENIRDELKQVRALLRRANRRKE